MPVKRYCKITAANGTKALEALDMQAGGAVALKDISDSDYQIWENVSLSDNRCKFVNRATKLALDVAFTGTDNGTPVHQWENIDTETQIWYVTDDTIISAYANKCLDVALEDGESVQLWDKLGTDNQKWAVVKTTVTKRASSATKKKPAAKKAPAKKETAPAAKKQAAATKKASTAKKTTTAKKPAAKKSETK